ncbi:aminoglycoside phosphotransferase family protein [Zhihengliuella halotolerans]|uniref:Aminoglycoside phosphotransferase (APT) family kinase protein n=1 Tax=Zhihengliuella halotolerans TaxID=370736 RepID=A0A4Q8ACR5_9MICC|nr:aminoglycoside phosphotransferase family protein [Zhihengliuella halotolerans]RZU62000.1 aminoglycoside phosphotransferase (APT) family kinase protein [Zhihengliuella halotolerans]
MSLPPADVDITDELVALLLASQHPDLEQLPRARAATGWDNVVYRLGDDFAMRLPRRLSAVELLRHEVEHLPALAPNLPLPVPAVVRTGHPGYGYPYEWAIVPWYPGTSAALAAPAERDGYAVELAVFLAAMHVEAPDDAPSSIFRGTDLALRQAAVGHRLAEFGAGLFAPAASEGFAPGTVDVLRSVVADGVSAATHTGPPRWLHGDPHPHNVVFGPDGRLAAVVDFGDLTSGDPAGDLGMVWLHFTPAGRAAFQEAYDDGASVPPGTAEALWRRARGWAVHYGLIAIMHDPAEPLHEVGRHALATLLEEGLSPSVGVRVRMN